MDACEQQRGFQPLRPGCACLVQYEQPGVLQHVLNAAVGMLRREAWLATVIECFRPVPDEPVALEIAATQQRTQSNTSWKKALRFVSQVMILLSSAFCQGPERGDKQEIYTGLDPYQ